MAHLFGAIKLRVLHKRKYCRRAETGNQPKAAAMKATYEFLQRFHAEMPDIAQRRRLSRDEQEELDNKAEVALVGKPFHGGRTPDVADLLAFGAIRGVKGWMCIIFCFASARWRICRSGMRRCSMRWAPPAAKSMHD